MLVLHARSTDNCKKMFLISAEYIQTSNNKYMIRKNNYTYCLQLKSNTGERWQCSKHNNKNLCKAFIKVNDGIIVKINEGHTHEPPKLTCLKGIYYKI